MQPQTPPYATHATLQCQCGKSISGDVEPAASWEQNADLASRFGWLPVILGDIVGASAGSHYYACSPQCQTEWLASLR